MSNAQYPTGTYVKGDSARVAHSAAEAVALVFEGYSLAKAETKTDTDAVLAPVADDAENVKPKSTRKS